MKHTRPHGRRCDCLVCLEDRDRETARQEEARKEARDVTRGEYEDLLARIEALEHPGART